MLTYIILFIGALLTVIWGVLLWLNLRKANKHLAEIARHLRNEAVKSERQSFLRAS